MFSPGMMFVAMPHYNYNNPKNALYIIVSVETIQGRRKVLQDAIVLCNGRLHKIQNIQNMKLKLHAEHAEK